MGKIKFDGHNFYIKGRDLGENCIIVKTYCLLFTKLCRLKFLVFKANTGLLIFNGLRSIAQVYDCHVHNAYCCAFVCSSPLLALPQDEITACKYNVNGFM